MKKMVLGVTIFILLISGVAGATEKVEFSGEAPSGGIPIQIDYPANNSSFLQGEIISFSGNASGGTAPYDYSWTSSIDGFIANVSSINSPWEGNRTHIFSFSLSTGTHVITMTVNDSGGRTNSTSATITINPASTINISGQSATGVMIWNASNFPALTTDTLNVYSLTSRTIYDPTGMGGNGLWYNTTKQLIPYQVFSATGNTVVNGEGGGGYYAKVGWFGKTYVALRGQTRKLAKLVLEQNDTEKQTLTINGNVTVDESEVPYDFETWDLKENYSISVMSVDPNFWPRQAWLQIRKDNIPIDNRTESEGNTYTYTNGSLLINLTLDMVFTGISSNLVILKNVSQYSEVNGSILINNATHQFIAGNTSGIDWEINDGYKIKMVDIDVKAYPRMVWMRLNKSNSIVDDKVVSWGEKYSYSNGSTPVLNSTIDSIFKGINTTMVKLNGIYQFSEVNGSILINNETHQFITGNISGIDWQINDGYKIKMVDIDPYAYPRMVWIRLNKGDNIVDDKVVSWGEKYSYSNGSTPVLNSTIESIFSGTSTTLVKLSDIYQYSEVNGSILINNGMHEFIAGTTERGNWALPDSYYFSLIDIDFKATPRMAWVEFGKSGTKLDDRTISQGGVYTYVAHDKGHESDVPMFVTYVDSMFAGRESDAVYLKYTWLISDNNILELSAGDRIGNLEVMTASTDAINMTNKDTSISLSQDSTQNIAYGLRFKVKDTDPLEYYPEMAVISGSGAGSASSGGGSGGGHADVCAALCHNYIKKLDRNVDFYPNTTTSFDRYETFLGILNQMRDTFMNVTDPTIDFYFNNSELYGSKYDYFRKVQPSVQEEGHAFFEFENMTFSNGNGTYGINEGERIDTTGFSVRRQVENNGLVTKDGYYNTTVSAVLYENVTGFIALSAGLGNSSEFNTWIVNWSTNTSTSENDTHLDYVNVNFDTLNKALPREYNLTVTFYVDKIIPANITLKPWVSVTTRNDLQTNTSINVSSISINGTMFSMNSTITSSNDNLTWLAQEAHEKRIEFDGGILEILNPYATLSLNKDFVVATENDSLSSGNYNRNLWYGLDIYNENDTSDTVLGNLMFRAKADNITGVGWEQYATSNKTSVNWTFPSSYNIQENDGFGTGFTTNYSESRDLNVSISRWLNQTEFSTDSYQLAEFNVTFENKNFNWTWARIEANDRYEVNTSIVPGTFTSDAPGNFNERKHGVNFDFDKDSIVPGVTYNFSVIVRVKLTGNEAPPISSKPKFSVGVGLSYNSTFSQGYTVEMPTEMLPDNVTQAFASTNVSNSWLLNIQNHTIAELSDVSGAQISLNSTNNVCAGLCHNYVKRLDRSVDFYPNNTTSFDGYETFLGILNQMRDTPMNVTDPTIDFYFNNSELYGSKYDYFLKVQPSVTGEGHAFFEFKNMTLSNGNGTTGVDIGDRTDTTGFSVQRIVENNGLVTGDGYYNVTVSAILYENVNEFISLSAYLGNTSEYDAWLVDWKSKDQIVDINTSESGVRVNFKTRDEPLPKTYNLTAKFYVNKIIPANITLKPSITVSTRNILQQNETDKTGSVKINGTMFDMNSTFASSNHNLTWLTQEAHEKRIELDGGISEILDPYAEFTLNKNFIVKNDSDVISSGIYERNIWYDLGIDNKNDTSNKVIRNLVFNAGADNITRVDWEQYAIWNKTSVNWTFPSSYNIQENDGFYTGFTTNQSETKQLNVNVIRWMNQTAFSTPGYQLVKFNITFVNKDFDWVGVHIDAQNIYGVNASLVENSFTYDAPMWSIDEREHGLSFDLDKERLQTGVTYNFSAVIRVEPTGGRSLPVSYKPQITIGEGFYSNSTVGGIGNTVEIPVSMLPENVSHASASIDLHNVSWLINRYNIVVARLAMDITAPAITGFNVLPNTSVSIDNPATGRANVSDLNLMYAEFGVIDSSNKLDNNLTALVYYANDSGFSSMYVSPPWYSNSWRITNGTVQDVVTARYRTSHSDWQDYILVPGQFKKNASVGEVEALLWFNKTTGNLSNITTRDDTSISISDGISTFKISKTKFINGLDNPPGSVDGASYVLYSTVDNPNNPRLVSAYVPSGNYKMLVHAEDIFGNNNAAIENIVVTQDSTLPTVTFIPPTPANNSFVNSANFSLFVNISANKNLSDAVFVKHSYYPNGTPMGNWTTSMSGQGKNWYVNITFVNAPDQILYYYVAANDTTGNQNVSNTRIFTVDTTLPILTIVSPVNKTYNNSSIMLNVTSNEALNSRWYSLNGGTNITFTSPTTIIAQEGFNNLTVYANDTAGNIGTAKVNFTVDTISPVLTIISPVNKTYNSSSIMLNVTANEALNSRWYSLNGGSNISFTSPTTIIAQEGSNNLTVYANDTADNIGTAKVNFTVDTFQPVLTIISPANKTYNSSSIMLNVTANETIINTWYSLNSGANITFTSPDSISASEGENKLIVYANDTAGNIGTAKVNFTVDTKPPDITSPPDLNVKQFALANITWMINDANPHNYTVYRSGTLVTAGGYNNGSRISQVVYTNLPGTWNYTIIANDTQGHSSQDDVLVTVTEENRYGIRMTLHKLSSQVEQNESAVYNITIKNEGNTQDSIGLEVENNDRADYANLSSSSLSLNQNEEKNITLTVRDLDVGVYAVVVKATSLGSAASQVANTVTTVISAVKVSSDSLVKATQKNIYAVYVVNIKNTGTKNHSFNLINISDADNATLSNTSVFVLEGESKDVILTVVDSDRGDYYTRVRAEDTIEPFKFDEVMIKTRVSDRPIYGVGLTVDENEKLVNENATYNITVKNTGNINDTITLIVDKGLANASVNKSILSLEAGASEVVSLNVSPQYSRGAPVPGTYMVSVTGVSKNDSSKKNTIITTTKVKGYGIGISAPHKTRTIYSGENATFNFIVENIGNVNDTITLAIADSTSRIAEISPTIISLDSGESKEISLKLGDNRTGSFNATINTTSQGLIEGGNQINSNAKPNATFIINVVEMPFYDVGLAADKTSQNVDLGENATYTLTVNNLGNRPDNVTLNAISVGKITDVISLNTTPIPLMPGDSASRILTVRSSSKGDYDVNVIASSSSDASKNATLGISTSVLEPVLMTVTPSSQAALENNNVSFMATIKNTGAKLHLYNLSLTSTTYASFEADNNITLYPGQSRDIAVNVNVSKGAHTTIFTASTDGNDMSVSMRTIGIPVTRNVSGVRMSVDETSKEVFTNSNATYTITVENLGNQYDTFNLTLEGSGSINVLNPPNISLNASTSGTVFLDVGSETPGSYTVKVTATSLSGVHYSINTITHVLRKPDDVNCPPPDQNSNLKPSDFIDTDGDGIDDNGAYPLLENSEVTNSKFCSYKLIDSKLIKSNALSSNIYNSAATQSEVNRSNINESEITNSKLGTRGIVTIANSKIINSEIKAGRVLRSTVRNAVVGSVVEDGIFKEGNITLEGIVYSTATPINLSDVVTDVQREDATLAGMENESTAFESSFVNLSIKAKKDFVGGTINVVRSSISPKDASSISNNISIWINVEKSDNLIDAMDETLMKVYYENVPSGIDETSLRINRFNGTAWNALECRSSICIGSDAQGKFVIGITKNFSTFALAGALVSSKDNGQGTGCGGAGGGGGWGGGGGGPSGENASNILVKEKYDLHIFKDTATSYAFTNSSNPVKFVNITGNVNAGEINVAVEVLKGTSTLVNVSPPGVVYKNVNIWVGTSGFAVPKNIKNATVEFVVDKRWIAENNIKSVTLLHYDTTNKEWVSLPTSRIKETTTEDYYQGETDRFSPFVISGGNSQESALSIPAQTAPAPAVDEETPVSKEPQGENENTIIAILSSLLFLGLPKSDKTPVWTSTAILFVIVSALSIKLYLLKRRSKR
ncbi:MAG: S-layer protein domain-containing protein [Candidatus Methanoperedens sp.]|nr:S-layer protein domain-containing protein [Candidatus Methanoperedens sp.]